MLVARTVAGFSRSLGRTLGRHALGLWALGRHALGVWALALGAAGAPGCALVEDTEDTPPGVDGGTRPRDGALPECGSPVECGDENPCTDDRCVEGLCAHAPMEAGAPCRDNELCNGEESCDAAGICQPGSPVECAPPGLCETSACDGNTGRCVAQTVADCCVDDADCARPASSACRATRCHPESHTCEPIRLPGCCEADADCPAGPCEVSRCEPEKHTCELEPVADCCTADTDCPAGVCSTSLCNLETRRCEGGPVADCCLHDGDCPPPPPCAESLCEAGSNRCVTRPLAGCCVTDADCGAGRTCDAGAHACVDQPAACCATDADCGAPVGCLVPTCAGGDTCCVLQRLPDCCTGDLDCPAGMRCDALRAACEPTPVEYAAAQFPVTPFTVCAGDETPLLFGRVFVSGRTPGLGAGAFIDGEVGFGPVGVSPDDPVYTWTVALYNRDIVNGFGELNDDEYRAIFVAPAAGDYEVAWRFRVNEGAWVYGDLVPEGSTDGYASVSSLRMHTDDCGRLPVAYAGFQHPLEPLELCVGQETPPLFGRVYVEGRTPGEGQGAELLADLGYGPLGSMPDFPGGPAWSWVAGRYNGDLRNGFGELADDEYRAVLTDLPAGAFTLAWRFSTPGGAPAYGDLPPAGSTDGFDPATTVTLEVRESGDNCP